MDVKVKFFFFLASVICLGVAAAAPALARPGRPGLAPRVALEPLGLALFVFPFMWDAAVLGF